MRGMGKSIDKCDAGEELIMRKCFPKCNDGWTSGKAGTCWK